MTAFRGPSTNGQGRAPKTPAAKKRHVVPFEDNRHLTRLLGEHHVPVAPILSIQQVMNHPHMKYRATVRTITDRGAGSFEMPGMPLRFSAFANDLDLQAPYLGEHNDAVLGGLLGLSAQRLAELAADGVLVSEPIPT